MRGQPTEQVQSNKPLFKVDNDTIITSSGGALKGGLFQQIGKPTKQAKQVFNAQRPMTNTTGLKSFNAGTPEYDYNSNFGFTWLAENTDVRDEIIRAAKELKVPAEWIVDIAAQESGAFRMATQIHPGSPNRNYGLFGFGSDSGVSNHTSLSPVDQVKAYVKYMKDNGWMKHVQTAKGNATIAQFWAMTRMGWNWRQQALKNNRIHYNFGDTGKTYLDELRLLGNHVGREYDVPGGSRSGRARRSSAVSPDPHSNLQQSLHANGTDIHTRGA